MFKPFKSLKPHLFPPPRRGASARERTDYSISTCLVSVRVNEAGIAWNVLARETNYCLPRHS